VMSHYTWSKNIDYDGTYYPRDARLARGVASNNRAHVFFVASMYELQESHAPLLGRMMSMAPKLMREHGATNGFRVVINTGEDGRQEVPHVHMHVVGGPRPWAKG